MRVELVNKGFSPYAIVVETKDDADLITDALYDFRENFPSGPIREKIETLLADIRSREVDEAYEDD